MTAGARIDRYVIDRLIGRGRTGAVYAARDPELDRDVAIRIVESPDGAAQRRREAQAQSRLGHPNVVRIYDVGEHTGQLFVTMELIQGATLRAWLASAPTVGQIVDVIRQAANGLAAAHRAGLVHRGFSADSVFVGSAGEVLVDDLGLAGRIEPPPPSEDGVPPRSLAATTSAETSSAALPDGASSDALRTSAADQQALCRVAWEACFGAAAPAKQVGRTAPVHVERALRRGLAAEFTSLDQLAAALSPRSRGRWPWLAGAALAATASTAAVLLAMRAARPSEVVDCDAAAATLAPVWSDASERDLAGRFGPGMATSFSRYAQSWRRLRIEACRATHVEHAQTVDALERQVACLDRARTALRTTLDALRAPAPAALPRPGYALEGLPSLERCAVTTTPAAAPPADRAAEIATLDAELTKVDVGLLAGSPAVSTVAATALRQRAEHLAYGPQVLRALMIEARVAAWAGDPETAERVLRRVMTDAERASDDYARALAGAVLARTIAPRRPDEADQLAEAARATLARAGSDLAIEQALLEARVTIASSREDHVGAAALQEQVVALVIRRFGEDNEVLVHAYRILGMQYSLADDLTRSLAVQRLGMKIAVRNELAGHVPKDQEALLSQNSVELLAIGDFEGAIALDQRQLAVLRSRKEAPLSALATATNSLALSMELDGAYGDALDTYRAAEQLWQRPISEFRAAGEEVSPSEIARGTVDAIAGEGSSLVGLGRTADAIPVIRRAVALAVAGPGTADQLDQLHRLLGEALVDTGQYHDGRQLLGPVMAALTSDSPLKPYPRALARFALARALWADGAPSDRPHALALLADAEREIEEAVDDGLKLPYLRKLPPLARALGARIAAWRAAHPAP